MASVIKIILYVLRTHHLKLLFKWKIFSDLHSLLGFHDINFTLHSIREREQQQQKSTTTISNRKYNFYALESLVSYFSIIPSVAGVLKTIRWLKSKKRVCR